MSSSLVMFVKQLLIVLLVLGGAPSIARAQTFLNLGTILNCTAGQVPVNGGGGVTDWSCGTTSGTGTVTTTSTLTTGTIPKASGGAALADSIITISGSTATVTGTGNFTTGINLNGTSLNTCNTLTNVLYNGSCVNTGDLKFTDATYDIGKSGATRPRDLFLSRNVTAGGTGDFGGLVTVTQPSTSAYGLVVAMPASTTKGAQTWKYNGTIFMSALVGANDAAFTIGGEGGVSAGVNLGNNKMGPNLRIDHNSNAGPEGGSAGSMRMLRASGNENWLWVDNSGSPGKFRIHTAAPTGSSGSPTVSDTAGTVVGDQTSPCWLKRPAKGGDNSCNKDAWARSRNTDLSGALAKVRALAIYDWVYDEQAPSYQMSTGRAQQFTGAVIFDKDVWYGKGFGRQQVPALNEINLHGFEVLSIQALAQQADTFAARLAALETKIK